MTIYCKFTTVNCYDFPPDAIRKITCLHGALHSPAKILQQTEVTCRLLCTEVSHLFCSSIGERCAGRKQAVEKKKMLDFITISELTISTWDICGRCVFPLENVYFQIAGPASTSALIPMQQVKARTTEHMDQSIFFATLGCTSRSPQRPSHGVTVNPNDQ